MDWALALFFPDLQSCTEDINFMAPQPMHTLHYYNKVNLHAQTKKINFFVVACLE